MIQMYIINNVRQLEMDTFEKYVLEKMIRRQTTSICIFIFFNKQMTDEKYITEKLTLPSDMRIAFDFQVIFSIDVVQSMCFFCTTSTEDHHVSTLIMYGFVFLF